MKASYPDRTKAADAAVAEPEDVVEVPLLLPCWQVSALATAAHDRGLTAGQMVRSLLSDFIARCRLSGADLCDSDGR
jgi:hypothetical protein